MTRTLRKFRTLAIATLFAATATAGDVSERVVVLHTRAGCAPCAQAVAWVRKNEAPFRVKVRGDSDGTVPRWEWSDADGKRWKIEGWRGPETIRDIRRALEQH